MPMLHEFQSCACAGDARRSARKNNRRQAGRLSVDFPGPPESGDSGFAGSSAMVYQLGTLRNDEEFGGIELSSMLADPEGDYALHSPYVTLLSSGTYLVQYAVFIPETASVNTVFCLQMRDRTLLSSTVHATKGVSRQGASYFGQALIAAVRPADICLASQKKIDVSGTTATAMATISFLKIR